MSENYVIKLTIFVICGYFLHLQFSSDILPVLGAA